MLGQVGPNIKSTALTWHEWAPNNKVTLCRGAQSHNLTAIAKLVFFHFGLASNTVCGFVDTVAWLVCQRVMYYVCIAYYPENDIRWRLMAYRYFETYMFSTGRNTTNSKNTTYFWFGGDNKPRGFLPSNIIQFVFMALACIFFYCMPLSTDEEPFLLHGQLNIAISATRQLQLVEFLPAGVSCM